MYILSISESGCNILCSIFIHQNSDVRKRFRAASDFMLPINGSQSYDHVSGTSTGLASELAFERQKKMKTCSMNFEFMMSRIRRSFGINRLRLKKIWQEKWPISYGAVKV